MKKKSTKQQAQVTARAILKALGVNVPDGDVSKFTRDKVQIMKAGRKK